MSLKSLTDAEVKAIQTREAKRYSGRDLYNATRTEVHAELQLRNPPPHSDFPKHIDRDRREPLSPEEKLAVQRHQRAQISDAHHIEFSKIRGEHPYILDGHHYVQWKHGKTLWEETDRLLAAVGIVSPK
jgi:hypothetical protein